MVMNCVNLRSMKPAKWLSSPRWMGRRSCKVRTHNCRTEERVGEGAGRERKIGGNETGRKEGRALAQLCAPSFPATAALCVGF